jgi:hypothetical protein
MSLSNNSFLQHTHNIHLLRSQTILHHVNHDRTRSLFLRAFEDLGLDSHGNTENNVEERSSVTLSSFLNQTRTTRNKNMKLDYISNVKIELLLN